MIIELPEIACVLIHGRNHEFARGLTARLFAPDEIFDMKTLSAAELQRIVRARVVAGDMTAIIEAGSPPGAHKLRVALASIARENYARRFAIILPGTKAGEPNIEERVKADGYREVFDIPADALDDLGIARNKMPTDRRTEKGPFDIIGDVHGCCDELELLLERLGYQVSWHDDGANGRRPSVIPPKGRRVIFVGDLVDRGPRSRDVLAIVHAMVMGGSALLVPGNHDVKFLRWLEGGKVAMTHGLDQTVASLKGASDQFLADVCAMLKPLWSHVWVDGGALAVAHAGILAAMIGRATPRVRRFCLYGDTTGGRDEATGLPIRYHWALDYEGETAVVYGHTPVPDAAWVNNTLCVDTGCCFGGKLTALRWPEREIVSVPAATAYAPMLRSFGHPPPRPK
ncbi:MAG: metallophosphoesterase [Hyphomicrobiaceae bacterium]